MARDPFRLVLDRAELDRVLEGEDGPVAADLAIKAARIANSARRRAPRRTGRLRSSIRWELGRDTDGLFADVGTEELYGRFVELGHVAPDESRVSPRRYLRPALRALRR